MCYALLAPGADGSCFAMPGNTIGSLLAAESMPVAKVPSEQEPNEEPPAEEPWVLMRRS